MRFSSPADTREELFVRLDATERRLLRLLERSGVLESFVRDRATVDRFGAAGADGFGTAAAWLDRTAFGGVGTAERWDAVAGLDLGVVDALADGSTIGRLPELLAPDFAAA